MKIETFRNKWKNKSKNCNGNCVNILWLSWTSFAVHFCSILATLICASFYPQSIKASFPQAFQHKIKCRRRNEIINQFTFSRPLYALHRRSPIIVASANHQPNDKNALRHFALPLIDNLFCVNMVTFRHQRAPSAASLFSRMILDRIELNMWK